MELNEINLKTNTELLIEYLEAVIADEMALNSFIRGIKIIDLTDKSITIATPTNDEVQIIKKNYLAFFNQAVEQIFEKPLLIEFTTYKNKKNNIVNKLESQRIFSKYTFKNYVAASFNSEIVKISKEIIKKPGEFSPIYVCSLSGLGKTHLLHAIGNSFIKKGKRAIYIEPNFFTKTITNLSKQGGNAIQRYIEDINSFDVLLFDDIQNLGDREVTLRVLFNIINKAIDIDKQIVICSDKMPEELSGFESRFITRFSSGITTYIKRPTLNDFIKILKFKLKSKGIDPENWEKNALEFVARNNSNSIRSIEGAVKRIVFFSDNKKNIKYTYNFVLNIFKDFAIKLEELTPERIIEIISLYYKIPQKELLGKSRKKNLIVARHMIIWMLKKMLNISYVEIGRIVGGRNHSTILSSINKIETMMKTNNIVRLAAEKIEWRIKNAS